MTTNVSSIEREPDSPAEAASRPARVTVIVPCRNEEGYIGPCLDSILATTHPASALEVLVVDGGSTDATRAAVGDYARRYPTVRLLDNPRGIVPAALNQGIRAATGDVIVRMDAHVVYPPDYIPRLVAALEASGADNVGATIRTLPARPGPVARAVATALAHPFGVGNSHFRIGTQEPRWVDTVPFGCYRREVFSRIGLFDEALIRNQDDEFNHRLLRRGGRILLVPEVSAYYYARPSFSTLARMYYQYGRFKPLVAKKVGRVMTWRQLVPPVFVLALIGLAALAPFWRTAAALWGLVAASYGLAVLIAALPVALAQGVRSGLALGAAFPLLHVSYGAGFLVGLGDLLWRRAPVDPATVPLSR